VPPTRRRLPASHDHSTWNRGLSKHPERPFKEVARSYHLGHTASIFDFPHRKAFLVGIAQPQKTREPTRNDREQSEPIGTTYCRSGTVFQAKSQVGGEGQVRLLIRWFRVRFPGDPHLDV
jgi:hypothetical protein